MRRPIPLAGLAGFFTLALVVGCTSSPSPSPSSSASTVDPPFIIGLEDFPRIDGSTATHPLGLAFKEAFTGTNLTPEDVPFSKTHQAYLNLIAGETDLILVTSPSEDELAAAAEAGVELEVVPVVNEGFVFLTNADNQVTDLTVDQLRDIYSGQITSWDQVGGPTGRITAYQRPENSGSQTGMLDLVMQGTPMVSAPQMQIPDMERIIDAVAEFDGAAGALGYSYYYYVTAMYGPLAVGQQQDGIRLLSVAGVAPTPETIKDGTYPLTSAYYIVIRGDEAEDSVVRSLVRAMLSPQGQAVAQQAGYVPVGDVADLIAPLPYTPPTAASPYAVGSLDETWSLYPVTLTAEVQDGIVRVALGGLTDKSIEADISSAFAKAQDDFRATQPGFVADSVSVGDVTWADGRWQGGSSTSKTTTGTTYVYGNIISIAEASEDGSLGAVLNIRVDTGEIVEFADLFTDEAFIEGILADAYRTTLASASPRTSTSDWAKFSDPADIETRIIDLIADYRVVKNPDFHLWSYAETGSRLVVSFGNYTIEFPLVQYWQSVAVPHRFTTDDDAALYTGAPRSTSVFRTEVY